MSRGHWWHEKRLGRRLCWGSMEEAMQTATGIEPKGMLTKLEQLYLSRLGKY